MADEEIYDDGTSITNETVTGVRNMRAMFETTKTDHPLSRGFTSKPSVIKKTNPTPPADTSAQSGGTTLSKVPVLPSKALKPPTLRHVTPLANVNTAASSAMKPPSVALKPTGPKSPPAQDSSGSTRTNGAFKVSDAPSNETGASTDFRSLLKKTNKPTGPQPVAVAAGGTVETTVTPSAQPGKTVEERKSVGGKKQEEAEAIDRRPFRGWKETQVRRSILTRSHDNKRFRRAPPPSSLPQEAPPAKPPLPSGVDLAPLLQQYKAELARCGAEGSEVEGEMDDDYDDVGVRPVSMVPEMTEEEELGDQAGETDDVYDDAQTVMEEKNPDGGESDGETYEALDDLVQQTQDSGGSADTGSIKSDKERNDKDAAKLKKQEEKERKEREKKEKEEKKKMEKKKKEERDMRVKFKLQPDGEVETQGEGKLLKDAKGRGLDLAVKAGEKVSIVRMNGNPKGKWLVQNEEGKLGFVDSKLVETMSTVKSGAEGGAKSPAPAANGPSGGGDEEPYDPVDDDIYEEV